MNKVLAGWLTGFAIDAFAMYISFNVPTVFYSDVYAVRNSHMRDPTLPWSRVCAYAILLMKEGVRPINAWEAAYAHHVNDFAKGGDVRSMHLQLSVPVPKGALALLVANCCSFEVPPPPLPLIATWHSTHAQLTP